MTVKYQVTAEYIAQMDLLVEVAEGDDPLDPGNWIEIISEEQSDFRLYDVISAVKDEQNV